MRDVNGKLIYEGEQILVNNTTYNALNTDTEYQIITKGTSTIVLPAASSKVKYHIFVKSGTCQITGTVEGVSNPLLTASNLEYDIYCDGTQYFNVRTERESLHTIADGVRYLFSTANSTTSQLTSGASFTGTIEDVTRYPSISFQAFADQNLTITIDQFIDLAGTKISESRTLSYITGEKLAISYPINGNYIRVTVKNEGPSTTTTLQIDTAYGQIETNDSIQDDFLRGQSAQTATVNNILTPTAGVAAIDVTKYRSFTCQVVSTGTGGTFIFEGSNDGNNFQAIPVYNQALVVRVPIVTAITATASQIIYEGACNFKFLRLRIATTITGGSIQAHTILMHTVLATTAQVVSNGTAANLLATVSGSLTSAGTVTNTPTTPTASAINSAATTNATSVKASAGTVYNVLVSNTGASTRYVKLYNKASAPTVGTDVPLITIAVPTNGTVQANMGGLGHRFATGIALAITAGAADSDTAAVGANEVKVLTSYI